MKQKKNTMKFRLLFVLLIIGVVLIYNSWHCMVFEFASIPSLFKNTNIKTVTILYGYGICGTCPIGKFVDSSKERTDILFLLPPDFSQYEIENFKDSFKVKGSVIKGNEELYSYLKKLSKCNSDIPPESNLVIELGKDSKIENITKI